MARLSDPESLLRKMTDLASHIDEFYETAELAKQIKDRQIQSHETALYYEKRFETRAAEIESLKTGYEKNLLILQHLISQSSEELGNILTDLGYEKNTAAAFIKKLAADRASLAGQYKNAETSLSVTAKEITGQMAWLWKEQETSLWKNRCLILREMDENRVNAEKNADSLMLFSEQTQEEISHLTEQTMQRQEDAEKQLYKKIRAFESLKNLYEKAAQQIAEIGRKYETERAGLVDGFRTEKQAVQAVVEKLICERRIFREDLLILEKEKTGILKEITEQSAWFSQQIADFLRDAHYRIAEHLDENRNFVLADRENLSLFAQEVKEDLLLHQYELESIEKQTKTRISRKIRDFDQVQSEYEKFFQNLQGFAAHCDAQLLDLLTDLGFAKQNLRKTAQQLAGEYQQALQQHRQIEQENQTVLNTITGQLAFAEKSVQENLAMIRLHAAQSVEEHRIHMQNAWEELNHFSNEIREEISALQNGAEKFLNRKAFALSRIVNDLKLQAEHFRKSAMEKMEEHLAIESRQLQQISAQEFQHLHTAVEEEKTRLAHQMDKQIKEGLAQLSDIKEKICHQIQWFRQMGSQWEAFCREADAGLAGLRKTMLCSDRDFMQIRTDFAYEKMQIQEQIRQMDLKYAQIREQQRKSEHFVREYLREITERISYESLELLKKFQENDCRIAQRMDEHLHMMEQEKAEFSLISDLMQEESQYLADEMERFRNETLAHLNHRYRKLSYRHEQFWQALSKEIRKMFSRESQKLHTAAESDRKEMVVRFHENFEAVLQDMRIRFAQEMEECKISARKNTENLTLSFSQAQEEISRLKEEWTGLQQKILSDTDQKISDLSAQSQQFRENFPKELDGNLNEKLNDFQQKILSDTDQKISDLSAQSQQFRENFPKQLDGNLNEKLTGLQQKILSDTDQKISALSALQEQFRQRVAKELDGNLNEKLTGLQQKILSDTEQKISNLSTEQDQLRESIAKDLSAEQEQLRESIAKETNGSLNEKFTEFQQKILSDTAQKISDLSAQSQQFRENFPKELDGNLNEKLNDFQQKILSDTEQKISNLSAEQEHLRESIAKDLSAEQEHLRESIAKELDGNLNEKLTELQQKILSDMDQKISDLSAQSQQFRENFPKELDGNLNEKLTGLQQKILSDTDQKISALSALQEQFRQRVAKELEKYLSQMGKQGIPVQEKEQIDAALSLMKSEQNGILQDQKSLSQKLDRMDMELRQIATGIRQYQHTEKEMKSISGQVDTAKKEMGDMKKYLGAFAEQIKEKLRFDNEKQAAGQTDFRKKIVAALTARLGEDLRKLQDQDEINLREIRRSDKNMMEQMENLEAGMAETLDKMRAEQEKIVPFVRKNIGTLAERQKMQGEMLREFGERIKSIEDFLKSRTRKA